MNGDGAARSGPSEKRLMTAVAAAAADAFLPSSAAATNIDDDNVTDGDERERALPQVRARVPRARAQV